MQKKLLKGIIAIFTIFLLIGITPVTTSNKIVEPKQNNDITNYLSYILTSEITNEATVNEIINLIKEKIIDNPSLIKKTIVISHGWGIDTNVFKNSKLNIKRDLFYFWHYGQASKTGVESKTFVIRANDLTTTKTIELYRGTQTGFMIKPFGLYLFQKKTAPQLSHTLFIGFASYIYVNANEEIQIPISLNFPLP